VLCFFSAKLLRDLQRRRHRLGEDRLIVIHSVRYSGKVNQRQSEIIGEAPIATTDTQHRTMTAMLAQPMLAHIAAAADTVDRAANPLTGKLCRARIGAAANLLNLADELVAQHPMKTHITTGDFQVGGADAGATQLDQRLIGLELRLSVTAIQPRPCSVID